MGACPYCQNYIESGRSRCTRCGLFSTGSETGSIAGVTADNSTTLDQVASGETERIVTGGPWDAAWGGGFVPTSITLMGGPPGSGKTTLLMQIASIMADMSGKRVFYFSAEQSPGEIKIAAERFGIKNMDRFRVLSNTGAGAEISADLLKKDPPCMIVLDSISALVGKDAHAAIVIAKRFKKYSVECKAPGFLIAHMTKEHDYAGLMSLQHEVDTLVTLMPQGDGTRQLRSWKNRFGPTHVDYILKMTDKGIVGTKGQKAEVAEVDPVEERAEIMVEGMLARMRAKEMVAEIINGSGGLDGPGLDDDSDLDDEPPAAIAPPPAKKKKKPTPAVVELGGQKLVPLDKSKRRDKLPTGVVPPALPAAVLPPKRKKKHDAPDDICECGHARKDHVKGRCGGAGVNPKKAPPFVCRCTKFRLRPRKKKQT